MGGNDDMRSRFWGLLTCVKWDLILSCKVISFDCVSYHDDNGFSIGMLDFSEKLVGVPKSKGCKFVGRVYFSHFLDFYFQCFYGHMS